MIKLDARHHAKLIPVYGSARFDFPLIRAILEARQPGIAFVDSESDPGVALIVNRLGFAYCFGDISEPGASESLTELFTESPELQDRYILWYDPPDSITSKIADAYGENARYRRRIRYSFSSQRFRTLTGKSAQIDGAEVINMDVDTLAEAACFNLDLGSQFWPSDAAFLDQGYGVIVRYQGKMASICYSAATAGLQAEIDVATLDEFRGQGLARLATIGFIHRCMSAGIEPTWDCFDYNQPSIRLAENTGFVEIARYPFLSFNT